MRPGALIKCLRQCPHRSKRALLTSPTHRWLRQNDVFLANVQRNVIEEWKAEDPSFGTSLEAKVAAALLARQTISAPQTDTAYAAPHAKVCLQHPTIRVGATVYCGGVDRGMKTPTRPYGARAQEASHHARGEWCDEQELLQESSPSIEQGRTSREIVSRAAGGGALDCGVGMEGGRSRRKGRLQNKYMPE